MSANGGAIVAAIMSSERTQAERDGFAAQKAGLSIDAYPSGKYSFGSSRDGWERGYLKALHGESLTTEEGRSAQAGWKTWAAVVFTMFFVGTVMSLT